MSRRAFLLAISIVTLIAVLRVRSTHRIFAQVIDEPVHIAAGYNWLVQQRYDLDLEHPPLARAVLALALSIKRQIPPVETDWVLRGNALLQTEGRYKHNLAWARSGNLIFLIIALVATTAWSARHLGRTGALVSAAVYACIPPVLGHAGLATTDMAGAAMFPLALLTFERWLDERSMRNTLLLGLAAGLGLLCKFSFLVFFPPAALIVALFHSRRLRVSWSYLLLAAVVSIGVIWAGYFFHTAPVEEARPGGAKLVGYAIGGPLHERAMWVARNVPLPAPLFVYGLFNVKAHDINGHRAYLLGEWADHGWWYYFIVALAVKTPLALLALAVIGCCLRNRTAAMTTLVAFVVLMTTMTASINIGVRHILPMMAPLSIAAAAGLIELWRRNRVFQVASVALGGWLALNSVAAHPDYVAWFNEAAGTRPERILTDSNLDWGQDVLRLRRVIRNRSIRVWTASIFTNADLDALGFPPRYGIDLGAPPRGWLAISEMELAVKGGDDAYPWLLGQPYERVGKSIRLYYLH